MYKLFLDASMTYSCGIWAKGALYQCSSLLITSILWGFCLHV